MQVGADIDTRKSGALADLELIEHGLVRHRPPADREIDRHKRSPAIITINLLVQDARIEREMSERLEMELTFIESAIVRRSRGLLRLRGNQHARRPHAGGQAVRSPEIPYSAIHSNDTRN
jgi:hypothetical protein